MTGTAPKSAKAGARRTRGSALSTRIAPDVVEYLDSGKIGARSVSGERILLSRPGPTLDYWDGED